MWMAVGVCVSVGVLTWFGYRAIREWQRSSTLLAGRRAGETADLLAMALTRDMRAVQTSILTSPRWEEFLLDPSYDIRTAVVGAFARYPYPESFFAWHRREDPSKLAFFDRADRQPAWMPPSVGPHRFPVTMGFEPTVARQLVDHVLQDASRQRRFSIFEVSIAGVRYQVVARLLYRDVLRERLEGVFGFTVNLSWVRGHYFQELTEQVARIGGVQNGFVLMVVDDCDQVVAGNSRAPIRTRETRRPFSLTFFDPLVLALDAPENLTRRDWAVEVEPLTDPTLAAAIRGANRTLITAALSAAALALGLVLTARATRARVKLAEMRTEFVSSVTHELKTPLATIRAVGDTLVSGRINAPESMREYAQLVVQESKRLTRLVDNLLAYSRITDVTEAYTFEPLDPAVLIHEMLQRFHSQVTQRQFQVEMQVPADLPSVMADRVAMELLLDNVLDNAIRYSRDSRHILVFAGVRDSQVLIQLSDRGMGISRDELRHVVRRFFRGRRAASGGSGLGLAIANRIAADHGGSLTIESEIDVGTTVTLALPQAV